MDVLEDALKNRFPYIINAVRVEEIDLGITPFRIRKMTRMDPSVPLSEAHEPQKDNSRYVNMEVEFGYDGSQRKQASVSITFPEILDFEALLTFLPGFRTIYMCSFGSQ